MDRRLIQKTNGMNRQVFCKRKNVARAKAWDELSLLQRVMFYINLQRPKGLVTVCIAVHSVNETKVVLLKALPINAVRSSHVSFRYCSHSSPFPFHSKPNMNNEAFSKSSLIQSKHFCKSRNMSNLPSSLHPCIQHISIMSLCLP